MIGKDGAFGAGQAFGSQNLTKAVMQVPGIASVIDASRVSKITNEIPSFCSLLMDYDQFFLAQVQQSAAFACLFVRA